MPDLSAYIFAGHGPKYRFGLDHHAAPDALRALATRIESGEAILRGVTVETRASDQDFAEAVLTVRVVERKPDQPEAKAGDAP